MSEPARPRHRTVLSALRALDAEFLARSECYFGGGTRIVLELDEYRESADIDFLCASRDGYRALRGAVSDTSLGRIAKPGLKLAREVIADRWGDESALGRDAIDLAFMAARWGREPVRAGLGVAVKAYGNVVARAAKQAATKLLEHPAWRRRCAAALNLTDTRTLLAGLRRVAAGRW